MRRSSLSFLSAITLFSAPSVPRPVMAQQWTRLTVGAPLLPPARAALDSLIPLAADSVAPRRPSPEGPIQRTILAAGMLGRAVAGVRYGQDRFGAAGPNNWFSAGTQRTIGAVVGGLLGAVTGAAVAQLLILPFHGRW